MKESRLIKGITYWAQLLMIPVYWLSFLIPRNRRIWIFGSTFGTRFAENPRYFFLYTSQYKKKEIRPIWISQNKRIVQQLNSEGYEAYFKNSMKGFWYCLIGGVYLYDNYPKDISHWLSGSAVKVNMWHGVPLKKIQKDNLFDHIRHPQSRRQWFHAIPRRVSDEKPSHYILATSDYFKPIFSSAFGTKKVLVNGYPRTDAFLTNLIHNVMSVDEEAIHGEINEKKNCGMKVLLYMPTFRDSEIEFFDVIQLEELNRYLEKHHYLLCVKLHCKSKLKTVFEKLQGSNIIMIPQEADPYVFVGQSDALITDYSSIYFDYLLTGKPIIFFCYDLEHYLHDSREMYFDYEDFTPGQKVQTQNELEMAMTQLFERTHDEEKRIEIMQKAFCVSERAASEDLYRKLLQITTKEIREA